MDLAQPDPSPFSGGHGGPLSGGAEVGVATEAGVLPWGSERSGGAESGGERKGREDAGLDLRGLCAASGAWTF